MQSNVETLKRLIDYSDIKKNIAQHSRGIDRSEPDFFKDVYHPNATVDYGFFVGAASELSTLVTSDQTDVPPTSHRNSNIWIKFENDKAVSESYVMAYSHDSTTDIQSFIGGCYLDTHGNRDGVWKLNHRLYVLDWNVNWEGSGSAAKDFVQPVIWGNQKGKDIFGRELDRWKKSSEEISVNQNTSITDALLRRAEEALTKQTIHELIMAQARATDRADLDSFLALWHPNATVETNFFNGKARDYCRKVLDSGANYRKISHHISNEWIEAKDERAIAESYVVTFLSRQDDDGDLWDEFIGGRYLDSFSKIDGEWRFTERKFIQDWNTKQRCSDQTGEGMYEALTTVGRKHPDDPVYSHWS